MDRFRAWGISALAAGLGATVANASDVPTKPAEEKPALFSRFLPGPKPAPADTKAAPTAPIVVAPLLPEQLAEAVRAEQMAYLRRLAVCTKLRDVASSVNDEKLQEKADDLEHQAFTIYQARIARLGVKTAPRTMDPDLDNKLGTGAGVNPLTVASPKPTDDKTKTASRGGVRQ